MRANPRIHASAPGAMIPTVAALLLGNLLVPVGVARAEDTRDAGDRCHLGLLGVQGSLVVGSRIVDAEAYAAGPFANRGKAIEAAKAEARRLATEELRGKVCGGLVDKADCEAEMSQALAPVERVFEDRYACVVLGIEANRLGTRTAAGQASRALSGLGGALRTTLRDLGAKGAVALDVVRTPEGCSAVGLEGARQQIAAALSGSGLDVLAPNAPTAGAWSVALEVVEAGVQLQIAARVAPPSGAGAARPVAEVAAFPTSAFGTLKLAKACAVPVKPRPGKDGLTARLFMPTQICAGEVLAPELEVSQPARVQVWSIAPDGSALLVVPGLDGNGQVVEGRWNGKRPLPAGVSTPNLVPGDEALLVVALPQDAPAAAQAPLSFCRVSRFDERRVPAGAAVTVHSWRVEEDPGHCPRAQEARQLLEQARVSIESAPDCR